MALLLLLLLLLLIDRHHSCGCRMMTMTMTRMMVPAVATAASAEVPYHPLRALLFFFFFSLRPLRTRQRYWQRLERNAALTHVHIGVIRQWKRVISLLWRHVVIVAGGMDSGERALFLLFDTVVSFFSSSSSFFFFLFYRRKLPLLLVKALRLISKERRAVCCSPDLRLQSLIPSALRCHSRWVGCRRFRHHPIESPIHHRCQTPPPLVRPILAVWGGGTWDFSPWFAFSLLPQGCCRFSPLCGG